MKLIIDIDEYAFERIKEYYDALPEESTVDAKVCYIANGISLDKIRAEIDKQAWAIAISDTDRANGMWDAYRIIDKYK